MIHYTIVFFIVALVASFFGWGDVAVGAKEIARLIFAVFSVGCFITFLLYLHERSTSDRGVAK